jgi:CheY-like chemotaxis protein
MTSTPKTCLIVDDDRLIVDYLSALVESLGHTVCAVAHEADEAARKAREHAPSVIFMDVRLGGPRDGVDAAIEIHKHAAPEIFFITASGDPKTIERIHQDSPAGILVKPVDPKALKLALEG